MNMLAIRMAQARLAARIWDCLKEEVGPELAVKILTGAIQADARAAGEAFARLAQGNPSLKHFATVLDRWQEGGALEITDMDLTASTLSFTVRTCAYARKYSEMGLEPELGAILSCVRDEPFAQGYSPCLYMQRSQTIMQGAPRCLFTFSWQE